MSDFNLPPGVSVNDIPGNRPEDIAEELFWEEVDATFIRKYGEEGKKLLMMLDDLDSSNLIIEYISVARDMGWIKGWDDAKKEENLYNEEAAKEKKAGSS